MTLHYFKAFERVVLLDSGGNTLYKELRTIQKISLTDLKIPSKSRKNTNEVLKQLPFRFHCTGSVVISWHPLPCLLLGRVQISQQSEKILRQSKISMVGSCCRMCGEVGTKRRSRCAATATTSPNESQLTFLFPKLPFATDAIIHCREETSRTSTPSYNAICGPTTMLKMTIT